MRMFCGTSTVGLGIIAMRLLNGDNDLFRLSLRERPFFFDFSESEISIKGKKNVSEN